LASMILDPISSFAQQPVCNPSMYSKRPAGHSAGVFQRNNGYLIVSFAFTV